MPAIQTSYASTYPIGFPGMIADMRNRTEITRELAGTTVLAFGSIALRGTTDHTILPVGGAGAGACLGIAVLDDTVRPSVTVNTYNVGDSAAILIRGLVWVTVTSAVTPGAPAYFDSSGNITAISSGNTAIPNGTFETTAASGALAQLRL